MTDTKIDITKDSKAKADKVLLVIGAARLGTNAPWSKVEDEAARISRLAEKFWLLRKSEMDFDQYTIMFVLTNYKKLLEADYKEDFIQGDDSAEELPDYREYQIRM